MARKAVFNPEDMQQANARWNDEDRETKYLPEDPVSRKKNRKTRQKKKQMRNRRALDDDEEAARKKSKHIRPQSYEI